MTFQHNPTQFLHFYFHLLKKRNPIFFGKNLNLFFQIKLEVNPIDLKYVLEKYKLEFIENWTVNTFHDDE